MKQPQRLTRPAYWQLDLFVCGMIIGALAFMQAQIPPQWEILVDGGWAALLIAGMSIWVWANWPALCEEERRQRTQRKQYVGMAHRSLPHTLPLTPVQQRFLDTMDRYGRR